MAKKPAAAAPKNKWDDELEAIFAAHERIMAKRRAADVPKQFAKQTKWDDELDALNVAFERRYRAAVAEREKCDAAAAPRSEEPNRSLRRRSTKHPWNKICGEIARLCIDPKTRCVRVPKNETKLADAVLLFCQNTLKCDPPASDMREAVAAICNALRKI